MNRIARLTKHVAQPLGRWERNGSVGVKANLANWDSGHQVESPQKLREANKVEINPDDEFDEMIFLMILHGKCF